MQTILIVEDDVKMAALLQSHLQKYGYDAIVTEDFSAILEWISLHQPHLARFWSFWTIKKSRWKSPESVP
jgi:DNA-binding response OmpR family regulator